MRRDAAAACAAGAATLLFLGAGAAAAEPEYHVRLPAAAEIQLGERGAISLTIDPRPGREISTEGPLVIALRAAPEEGLGLPRQRYRRRHAADARARAPRFDLVARGEESGRYELEIRLEFWVCAMKTCRPVRERRVLPVHVPEPDPEPAPDPDPEPEPEP